MLFTRIRTFFYLFIIFSFMSFTHPVPASSGSIDICSDYISPAVDNIKKPDTGNIPFGEGLLWNIEAPNGSIAHIFGTMHSQDRLVTSIPPAVRLALVKSKEFVMEVLLDQHANKIFNDAIYFSSREDLRDLIDNEIFVWLENNISDYGIRKDELWRLKPWAAFTLVGRPKPVRALTQDIALMQIAESANINISSLETMTELISVLDGISMDDQINILIDTVCNHKEIIRQTRDVVNMYINRDLAGIVLLNEQPHYNEDIFERYIKQVVYDRNVRMVEKIERAMQQKNIFVAVGALHLPGKKGILYLLNKKGYKINLVY
jgi:uncharacterized protein